MMPKVTLKAPAGIGGQIHASKSGKNYNIDDAGFVVVDSPDAPDLLAAGYHVRPHEDGPDAEEGDLITSVSATSAFEGAQAFDENARGIYRRDVENAVPGTGQDFGGAIPPHGVPTPAADSVTSKRDETDAKLEAVTAAKTGADPTKPSAVPNTGAQNQQAGTQAQQVKAAEAVKG